jgi:hypothetical protein
MKIVERWLVANGEIMLLENGNYFYYDPYNSRIKYRMISKEEARQNINKTKKENE